MVISAAVPSNELTLSDPALFKKLRRELTFSTTASTGAWPEQAHPPDAFWELQLFSLFVTYVLRAWPESALCMCLKIEAFAWGSNYRIATNWGRRCPA
jgi:hypothetical protein